VGDFICLEPNNKDITKHSWASDRFGEILKIERKTRKRRDTEDDVQKYLKETIPSQRTNPIPRN